MSAKKAMGVLRLLRITGNEGWRQLGALSWRADQISISGCGDIHPYERAPTLSAPTLVIKGCNKNFPYYWLDPTIFPETNEIYLGSHPGGQELLRRFPYAKFYMGEKLQWVGQVQ